MPTIKQFKSKKEYNQWFKDYRNKHRKKITKYNREYMRNYRKKLSTGNTKKVIYK